VKSLILFLPLLLIGCDENDLMEPRVSCLSWETRSRIGTYQHCLEWGLSCLEPLKLFQTSDGKLACRLEENRS
jgi:hypothetical protein